MGVLSLIIGALTGPVAAQLAAALKERQNATTEQARIAADERIRKLQAMRDVQVAEAGSRINAIMRFFIALGPAIYIFKIFAIDKVICPALGGACRTDPLTPELWQVVTYVIGFYFLVEGGTMVARIVKRRG